MHARAESLCIYIASSNAGKLREYRALAESSGLALQVATISDFDSLAAFEESAPTFAENAAGKALHYSRLAAGLVLADDSGLVVPALGGAPGVHSARYAGPRASNAERNAMLLGEMRGKTGAQRRARFVCVIALAERGEVRGIFSAFAEGELLEAPRGAGGFGYDPVFYFPALQKTFAEISEKEKNLYSHRGITFRKAASFLAGLSPKSV